MDRRSFIGALLAAYPALRSCGQPPDLGGYKDVASEGTVRRFGQGQGRVICIWVRKVSGGPLLPGRLVKWKEGWNGRRVDG